MSLLTTPVDYRARGQFLNETTNVWEALRRSPPIDRLFDLCEDPFKAYVGFAGDQSPGVIGMSEFRLLAFRHGGFRAIDDSATGIALGRAIREWALEFQFVDDWLLDQAAYALGQAILGGSAIRRIWLVEPPDVVLETFGPSRRRQGESYDAFHKRLRKELQAFVKTARLAFGELRDDGPSQAANWTARRFAGQTLVEIATLASARNYVDTDTVKKTVERFVSRIVITPPWMHRRKPG